MKHILPCAALMLCLLTAGTILSAEVLAQTGPKAHRHPKLSEVTEQVLPEVTITQVALDKPSSKENVARSPGGRYEAFTSSHDESPSFRVYFIEKRTGKVYEVRGLPLPHRPFSDLAWTNKWTLIFDRWSQPHYGIHYVVNVREKELVSASTFPDKVD